LGAGLGWALSFAGSGRETWRTPSLQILLLAALGPGLLVNGVLKHAMGRPRPYETVYFGGTQPYLRPFEPGIPFHGSSFVSGHAAMAFLFVGLFFVLKGRGRWIALLGGTCFGLAVGWSRVIRGDHFPSDILLAGALDFVLAAALARLFREARSNTVYTGDRGGHNEPPPGESNTQGD
jgi:membrane-associated PAP2 superfamily phosphatase